MTTNTPPRQVRNEASRNAHEGGAEKENRDHIRLSGVRQNNLKNFDLDIAIGELTVVTGVSGSGKSSLVFDTLYAEGQRRYVETFSPYARQFLDRMDKPQVDRIEGVPPAIAIDQNNPVRTSRSTVGTMTEINDHLKLLYARASTLYCHGCGRKVERDSPDTIYIDLKAQAHRAGNPRVAICFPVTVPENFSDTEIEQFLTAQGYTRVHTREGDTLYVVQDRVRVSTTERARLMEALDIALQRGNGHLSVFSLEDGEPSHRWNYAATLSCASCAITYNAPLPAHFSFNNPLGACETCRGFGRVIGIDFGLVAPDERKTIAEGVVKPWQTESFKECQRDVEKYAARDGISLNKPLADFTPAERRWLFEGDERFVSWDKSWPKYWYGVRHYFGWLESKAYKMHIRVLLSKYRAYTPCLACEGARLKPAALDFRLGEEPNPVGPKFQPRHSKVAPQVFSTLPGLTIHDVMLRSIESLRVFLATIQLPKPIDEATDLVLAEVRARVKYLCDVGLGYLTLDRQSRTLSGGEVQRINLTTALGTSLTQTLFVLDEPSIGLHPRDMERVIGVMHRLKEKGNTLVVVEHDPQIMFAADRLLDIGPGPGERGGHVVFDGPTHALLKAEQSRTAAYLLGRERITRAPRTPTLEGITLKGVREHNLKNISVTFPLHALVCVTGVSGSGKSTLVENVLVPALYKAKGKPTDAPGAYDALLHHQRVDDVVFVDQTPIGKSSRSNPASFVGAWDAVRAIFAKAPLAAERKYTAGTFSFNAGTGRCPACTGTGFEHVEMQFLSDVYLRCPDCDGKRFRAEVREVAVQGVSVSDVLEMTVAQALVFFAPIKGGAEVVRLLQPLADVGLEYVRLGQPVPTLSGGEAQRLKLAGHLAESVGGRAISALPKRIAPQDPTQPRGKLFVFDEPTTGLHFDDIAVLLAAFDKLLNAGHSLIVIEHNLDVITAADWIIDLGPEGGDAGGEVLVCATPAEIMKSKRSHTGRSLVAYEASFRSLGKCVNEPKLPLKVPTAQLSGATSIHVHHAREHNLKNISVDIPHRGFTVITGPSGSGKSTLAFDIVFNEGQRRYLESLNAYARQFVQPSARPDVDAIYGIPPTVAIEQRTSRGGRKSTVATLTEIYHFLRLLWMKLGTQYCPKCDVPISPQSADAIVDTILKTHKGKSVSVLAPLIINRKGLYTDLAKWAKGKGFASLRVDGALLPTAAWPRLDRFVEHTIELPIVDIAVSAANEAALRKAVDDALSFGKGVLHLAVRGAVSVFSTKRACSTCGASYAELDPRLFSFNSKHGWCEGCQGTGQHLGKFRRDERTSEEEIDRVIDAYLDGEESDEPCKQCAGTRLNPVARAVRLRDLSLPALTQLSVIDVGNFFSAITLNERETAIARDVVSEVSSRLTFLQEVGLGYLALDRSAPTLSGGEAQRIRLAAQLGSNLQGVAYVLDEPTIGLHPRDNEILLNTLEKLEAKGNTLIVVEHDEDTIRRAHHVIDLGPGAGVRGGEIVAQGTAKALMANAASITGRYLKTPLQHPLQPYRDVKKTHPMIALTGVSQHNLHNVSAQVPLARLTVVTGVSGSGKSTLARDVLLKNLQAMVGWKKPEVALHGAKTLTGAASIDRVLEVDQTPIGKTPRSCPATYIGFWDNIRRIFAETTESKMRGWGPGRFSFNTAGGRCEACDGQGVKTIEMSFLPDVKLQCDVCAGARFNSETRQVRWRDQSISDVLAMDVDTAVPFFEAHPTIHHPLKLMQDVGLGYLTLGQPSPTLSGGEAQRIKLITELTKVKGLSAPTSHAKAAIAKATTAGAGTGVKTRAARMVNPHTLYVLDEPTVGLHMSDVEKLVRVLHRLVDANNTVVLVEHNLDVMAEADWIIDMGPEGGTGGGEVVVQGPVAKICAAKGKSHTGRVLTDFLKSR